MDRGTRAAVGLTNRRKAVRNPIQQKEIAGLDGGVIYARNQQGMAFPTKARDVADQAVLHSLDYRAVMAPWPIVAALTAPRCRVRWGVFWEAATSSVRPAAVCPILRGATDNQPTAAGLTSPLTDKQDDNTARNHNRRDLPRRVSHGQVRQMGLEHVGVLGSRPRRHGGDVPAYGGDEPYGVYRVAGLTAGGPR